MRKAAAVILVAVLAAAWPAAAQTGAVDATVLTRAPKGTMAAQLRLRLRLEMAGGASLAASLDHNRQEWKMLSPDQRERFRQYVVAFHNEELPEQDKLLKSYSAYLLLTKQKREAYRRRAQWVKAVVATFTPQQREQLRKMPSMQRAKTLIRRRDELVGEGKLILDLPTTAPARPER
jgi:hypothetical protein